MKDSMIARLEKTARELQEEVDSHDDDVFAVCWGRLDDWCVLCRLIG